MSTWIDFKALRAKLDFEQVLRHYKVEVKRKGQQHHGYCPLPNHNGKKNSPSFSANLERGIFQCFGCQAKGNVLEFAALMSNVDPKDGSALHRLAAELQKRFCPEIEFASEQPAPSPPIPEKKNPKEDVPALVNVPLDFELKGLSRDHPYLAGRGFTPETVEHFGLGYCSRGMLRERVAIPLHDREGHLVAYAGRVVDDAKITEDNPRYRFPGERQREGKVFEFRKSLFLYNGFRLKEPLDDLIVVESFTSIWWLHQNGITNAVGTMGSDCSDSQAELIVSLVKPNGRVWILGEGDNAGELHARSVLTKVSPHRFVRWVKLGEGRQPTDLPHEELHARLRRDRAK
jgi:DNA primase